MHDVIIIGARCAGSALALLLARAGLKVLVIDRTVFPSDTMSGHYIHPAGVACLKRWGVLGRLAATDTPAQERVTVDFGPVAVGGRPAPAPDGTTTGYAPRRWLFDPLLAEAAAEAGAELWQGVTVHGPIIEGGRVVGVTGVTRDGRRIEARARLVVGADGKRSRLAEAVGAEAYNVNPATTCTFYAYWGGFEADASETRLFVRDGRFVVAAPTNGGLTFLGAIFPVAEFRRVRANLTAEYRAALGEIPWVAERLARAELAQRPVGTADLDGFFRKAHGPGWALLGDAGYHRDPITAQGMTDAFRHAEFLAEAIVDGLAGKVALETALEGYARARDESVAPMYAMTNDMARLAAPSPETLALAEAVRDDPVEAGRFLGVISGTVPIPEFFAPENLARIMGAREAA